MNARELKITELTEIYYGYLMGFDGFPESYFHPTDLYSRIKRIDPTIT
jgi:hypothetical protein